MTGEPASPLLRRFVALQAVLPLRMRGLFRALRPVFVAAQAARSILRGHRVRDGWCAAASEDQASRKSSSSDRRHVDVWHRARLISDDAAAEPGRALSLPEPRRSLWVRMPRQDRPTSVPCLPPARATRWLTFQLLLTSCPPATS